MYVITCDGVVIHDSLSEDIRVMNPVAEFEMGATGKMTFSLPPTHPIYNGIRKLKSEITLWINGEWTFSGRVLNDDIAFNKVKKIEVEGELAYFNDSIVRPYEHTGDIRPLLEQLVDSHNSQVEPEKQFQVGLVTVTDPNNLIVRANKNYPSTWSELYEKFPKLLGGYFRTRHYEGVKYLDYIKDYASVNDQIIDFDSNLVDLKKYVKGEDVATAIIPLGAQLEESEDRLTIVDVNGGVDYVYDQDAVDLYGWVFKQITWDDVTIASNLLTKAYSALAEQKLLGITLDVSAIDLSLLDVSVERIKVGDKIRVISEPHSVDEFMEVNKISLDLTKPSNSKIELGSQRASLTDEIPNKIGNVIETVISDYAKNEAVTDKIGQAISDVTVELSSEISQSANEILLQVSGDYASKSELEQESIYLQSRIEQTESNVDIRFTETEQSVTNLQGVVQENQETLETYIRFDADGIELGKVGNEFTTELSNTELAFLQNGQKVAYISNNKMYITDAEIRNNLALGTPDSGYFDWIPRSNGNLSFKFRS